MKLIHTADWHLGNTFHGHDRADEHAHFLSWLLEVVRQQRPDALIISGDIFDTANPPARAEKQFFDFLIQATSAVEGLQVVATTTRQDASKRLPNCSRCTMFMCAEWCAGWRTPERLISTIISCL